MQLTKPSPDLCVLRGGSLFHPGRACRSADRPFCHYGPGIRAGDIGFRVCIPID